MVNSVAGIDRVTFLIAFHYWGCGSYFNLARDVFYGDRKIHVCFILQ